MMENTNQATSHPTQLSTQRFSHQMHSGMWNNKVCQSSNGQSTSMDAYSQQMNQYYQAQYPSQVTDINRYVSPVSKEQNSNSVAYSQYPVQRQSNYPCSPQSQVYQGTVKANCSSNMYYPNMNTSKNYPANNIHSSKKYVNSNLGIQQTHALPQNPQVARNTPTPIPQMPQYGNHNYPTQNVYVSNYNMHSSAENEQSYILQQSLSSSTPLPAAEPLLSSVSMVPTNQVSQVSSIPTPPETSSLPGDGLSAAENTSPEASTDSMKMNISNSFVLPGSVVSHMPSSVPSVTNSAMSIRTASNTLLPPANLDEGSQASSASASSSIPDEQNSVKTNSKPNFSYPPTPNTLSSPGAASMSSFHDDLECISSPSWPKTPASPVANSNYEFANIKRPENLLKLYTLSDEPDRRYFLDKLIVFNEDRGSPITQCPTISKQPLDVFRVYLTVKERGGFVEVTNAKRWKDIAGAIGVGASSSAAYTLRKQYMKLLLPFECKFDRGGIDPQPIINMVEASSRKKGKNSTVSSYGSQNHYGQGYPQSMDRYHSGYPASYQSSRYPCTNVIDFQCASNTSRYPQTSPNSAPQNSSAGQSQYNQYSQGTPSGYRYYQGNNSAASAGYNSNMPNNVGDNICRYNRNTSTPVPQDQGYFSHQYPTQLQGQNVQDMYNSNRGCSAQESQIMAVTNQINNELDQLAYSSIPSVNDASIKPDGLQHQKTNADGFNMAGVEVPLNPSDSSQENKVCLNSNYSTSNKTLVDHSSSSKVFPTGPNLSSAYSSSMPEVSLNKTTEAAYYHDSSYTNRNQDPYVNNVQPSYQNQKMLYQNDFQNKDQIQSSQYAHYSESQNESYRGSEGPPQVERSHNTASNKGISNNAAYQYNCPPSKPSNYQYAVPEQIRKDAFNSSAYSNQYPGRPQKAWGSEQAQLSYQHAGPRPQLKNQLNPADGKQQPEVSRQRKSWLSFQSSAQSQSKHNTSTSSLPQNQSFLSSKVQPQPNSTASTQGIHTGAKKLLEFPPNAIEAVKPVAVKRRRCPAKRLSSIDPWRLMLSLKSGLLAESTWALDAISILLADNSTVVYFNLDHLPGLLNVLVDHYRCFLNSIFDFAKDLELRKLSSNKEVSNNKLYLGANGIFNLDEKTKILDTSNFTYKTRCKKKVEIQYDEALFLIDPHRSWDKIEGFVVTSEHWQKGGGDITSHIQTSFTENTKKVKFCRELQSDKQNSCDKLSTETKSHLLKSSLLCKGEPIVVLKKFNFDSNNTGIITDPGSDGDDSCSIISINSCLEKNVSEKNSLEKTSHDGNDNSNTPDQELPQTCVASCSNTSDINIKADDEGSTKESSVDKTEVKCSDKSETQILSEENNLSDIKSSNEIAQKSPQLRGSLSSRKRFLREVLEDEAYCFDQPALCVMGDSQEMLSRRCVCVSTILRNLSFVPGNDIAMSKNPGVLVLLGRLLLLHHEHKPAKNAYHKYEKEIDEKDAESTWNESCTSLKDEHDWWWSTLNVLRDNTLVILSNISNHLDLSPFPEEVSLPILDGLLHWIVCPSSYAQDPLPSRSPSSVLSPQRLCLETLCKLSVLSNNVDLIIATPPWSRIENLLAFLTKSLSLGQDQIMREFAVVLLSNISQADCVAARTIAEQNCCISYLIAFIEEAEANAFQIASSQGTKKLRDKPELMGTTPGMVQRAADTLKNLALVPENRELFLRYQPQLLSLVMSQVMDQELLTIIADVLFYCSDDAMEGTCHLPFS